MEGVSLYILRCADGKLYTGLTRRDVDERVSEHQQGLSAFTRTRRPVELIFSEHYPQIIDAIAAERRIKGLYPRRTSGQNCGASRRSKRP